MSKKVYWFTARPEGVEHRHPFLVFDRQDRLHLPLTIFGKVATQHLDVSSVKSYLYGILPFFTFLEEDARQVQADRRWEAPPEQVRQAVDDYLVQRLRCLVQPHEPGYQVVSMTVGTLSTLRVFLSGLKLFYRVAGKCGYYPFSNPLVDSFSLTLADVSAELEEKKGFPRMPEESGVETPWRKRRLSDSYYKLAGEDWIPQVIDDHTFPEQVLKGGRTLKRWSLRDECVTRMLFESGGRVSEVVGLTVGGWGALGFRQEARAFNKGSHGRLVKTLRFWPDTVKLLQRYFDEERRKLDPQGYTLADYQHLSRRRKVDLSTVPLFLSAQRTPLSTKTYRDHAWNPACRAAGIDADVHQARHWYVTMMVRLIYEQSKTEAQVLADRQALIQYMKWKSGELTLNAYDHYFDSLRHVEIHDKLVEKLAHKNEQLIAEWLERPSSRLQLVSSADSMSVPTSPPTSLEDFDYAFLRRLGGGDHDS